MSFICWFFFFLTYTPLPRRFRFCFVYNVVILIFWASIAFESVILLGVIFGNDSCASVNVVGSSTPGTDIDIVETPRGRVFFFSSNCLASRMIEGLGRSVWPKIWACSRLKCVFE
jgi:hypothetical protein